MDNNFSIYNRIFSFLVFSFSIFLCSCASKSENVSNKRANVILIMTDDQGYGDLACHGNPNIKTPNLDKLYTQSIRLTNFHVGTTCAPTRAALMTGLNCNRVGVWHTIAGRSQLNASEMTMAEVFANNKYATGMFGKWHLGDSYPFRPHDRGFQETFYHGGGGIWQGPDYWDNDYFDDTYFRNGVAEKTKGYCTDVWFDEALSFIEKHREGPFFTYLATNAPHGPFHVDSSYINPYLKEGVVHSNFYGMITNLDDNMGRLLDKLEELELTENTLLIFMTDNGTARGVTLDKLNYLVEGYNANMRGQKGSMYEGGHRVPCFIRWPDRKIGGGKDISQLTAHVDLLPTFIDLLGLEMAPVVQFDGKSLAPLLTGNDSDPKWKNRILITDTQRQEIPEKWKKSATMQDKWRLINGTELYDIEADPEQRKDIAGLHPEVVTELRSGYEAWWAELTPGFSNFTRAVLGKEIGSQVNLYSHDWHEAEDNLGQPNIGGEGSHFTPWNQTQIRQGLMINGYWEVEIAESGNYKIELRRWPEELDVAITDGIPVKNAVAGGDPLPEGRALNIKIAGIKVGDQQLEKPIVQGDKKATFELTLERGPARVKTWFEGADDVRLGAYYVYATRLD